MYHLIKSSVKSILDQYYRIKVSHELEQAKKTAEIFEFNVFRKQILKYIGNQKIQGSELYSFSNSQNGTEIYSNTYALMTFGLLGVVDSINVDHAFEYIYNSQSADGLFRDQKLQCELAEKGHHWGWHHLAPHVIIAFDYLKEKPKYDFHNIIDKFTNHSMSDWLSSLDWKKNYLMTSNQIMNIGVLLQYSRDNFNNKRSGQLIAEMKDWLFHEKFDEKSILKNINVNKSKYEISKVVNAIYHIAPLFIYDHEKEGLPVNAIIKYVLMNQNSIGGFGPNIVTDACQDIDSVYLLSQLGGNDRDEKQSMAQFLDYIFLNRNSNNGFVFKKYGSFSYGGNNLMSSHKNSSNMFATWFRTLSIAFACDYMKIPNDFKYSNTSGYQYSGNKNHD